MNRRPVCLFYARVVFLAVGLLALFVPVGWSQANKTGQWQTLPYTMPINPVHVSLLYTGKVLVTSGSGNNPKNPNLQGALWDPQAGTVTVQAVDFDMFCNGMITLPDGRALIAGGTNAYAPPAFLGSQRVAIYDPATGVFTDQPSMAHGRWYPTLTELGDGSVIIFSGLSDTGPTNTSIERFSESSGMGPELSTPWTPPLYPRMHLLPDGTVFFSGNSPGSSIYHPSTNSWNLGVATTNYGKGRLYGSAVLLPMTPANGYKPRVMIFGGGSTSAPATNTTEIIDLSAANLQWVYGPAMSHPRIEMDATILPDGRVIALGGSTNDEDATTAALGADLYDPNSNTMSPAGTEAFARLYHTVSLLMPDGTVWVAGGNPAQGNYEPHMEIYSPPYLFNADGSLATRPTITSTSTSKVGYGAAFTVQTPDAANISSVVLMRNGSSTHAFDMDQRYVGLSFTAGSGVLNVTGPPSSNIAPPGYYMLFILNNSGVPSVATMVQVSVASTGQPPTGTITSPATDVTVNAGQSVTFAGTGTSPSGTISAYNWSFLGGTPATSNIANPGPVTYSTPGTHVATFTVTDNQGVTDPHPPSRTITVPDFTLAVSPSSNSAAQGASAPYTVTVTGGTGFAGTLTLSVSGLPTGASASFNPTSITNSGSSTMTVSTGTAAVGTYTLTVSASTGVLTHTATTSLVVGSGGGTGSINFGSGFSAAGMQFNGHTTLNGTRLQLTDTSTTYEQASAYWTTLVSVGSFTNDFNFQLTNPNADGFTFVLQNSGLTAMGTVGGGLGYAGMPTSVAVKFDLYDNNGEGNNSTGLYTNGNAPSTPATTLGGGVNLHSGDIFHVHMTYDGTTLTMVISDVTVPANTFTISWPINIPGTIGSNTAFAGFTAATGGGTAIQEILSWTYSTGAGAPPAATPTFSPVAGTYGAAQSVTISDTTAQSTIFYTTDGTTPGTTVGGSTQQFNPATPISVTASETINAVATASGFSTSAVGSAAYVITTAAATPTFSPVAGTYASAQSVTISDTTAGASIFYTTDGTTPGTTVGGSTQQFNPATPISVTASETIKAVATASGFSTSAVGSAAYVITTAAATPVITPATGTYTGTQTVTITDATANSTIFYTLDGTTPGTAVGGSTKQYVAGGFTVAATTTVKALATATGLTTSAVATSAITIQSGTAAINFGSGFTATGMQFNGHTTLNGTRLQLTDTSTTFEQASAYWTTLVSVGSFTNDFNFQLTNANADGFTFVLQNSGLTAMGTVGGGLGYAGMPTSVAVKFDLFDNGGEGNNSTGLYTNGNAPSIPATTLGGGVNLHSGDIFHVHMTYDGTTLTMVISDVTVPANTFTISWPINIPGTIGSNTAFAGFTAATGGGTAIQEILSWTYSTGAGATPAATPTFSPVAGTYTGTQTVTISDTTAGATIFYTTDGTTPATTVGGSTQQFNPATPISVTASETINAVATAPGFSTSAVGTAAYVINGATPAATPTFSPVAGTYGTAQSVTISDTTAGSTIFYTTDGTTPGTTVGGSTKQFNPATPISVTASETIKAVATASGFSTSAVGSAAYVITTAAATPTFSPVAGTYASAQSVTISDTTAGATIFYTTDGTTPGTTAGGSTQQFNPATPISVTASETIKAVATASGFSTSAVGSAAYVITTAAATPTFSPVAGTYGAAQSVTISDTTAGASIFYTTDGTTPGTTVGGSTQQFNPATPISVTASETIKAVATASGFSTSAVGSAAYVITTAAATPTFSPVAGTYASAQSVTISDTTAGASIFYTTDGTTPGTTVGGSTKQFSPATPISVTASETIKAVATASGFSTSAVGSAAYVITTPAATPTFNPVAGTYGAAQSVTISDTTAGASIFYTTDGTTPGTAVGGSTKQFNPATPISVTASETIKAVATASGFSTSAVGSAAYVITTAAATPTFSPVAGTYGAAQSVTISDTTAGASIFYTTDGTTPGTTVGGSTKQFNPATPISVTASETIKAVATAPGFSTSAVGSAAYVITTAAATPMITPATGTYTGTQTVTITDATANSTIFYTLDGTTPGTAVGGSTKQYVAGGFTVAATTTVKALATASGFATSAVASSTITIQGTTLINFGSGFTATGMQFNGHTKLNGTRLQLTDSGTYEQASAYWNTQVNVQSFTNDFNFQLTNAHADGFTFLVQRLGLTAIGTVGGGLGYAGLNKSVAVKFDLYNNDGEGTNSTGLYVNGSTPSIPATTLGGGVNLHSGDIFHVHMTYNGTTLTMTITDTNVPADTFTISWNINIPGTLGANTAFAGFTGSTGGGTTTQEILNWTYTH
jgi:hypothetical protein